MLFLVKRLPRKLLSRWVGFLVHLPLPPPLNELTIRFFASWYRIRIDEAERPPGQYSSIGDFFVRRLRSGVRPLAKAPVVHPADSRISQSGPIKDGWCVQAKGKKYTVRELLVDPDWKEKFQEGFFITYYLCPTDYHRVHAPADGMLRRVTYVPGDLWPVNEASVEGIPELFLKNERVCLEFATEFGAMALVFVGATNVGSIELSFDPTVRGNCGKPFVCKDYSPPKEIRKGQEVGMFRMGSTVVMLYSAEFVRRFGKKLNLGPVVRVNAALTNADAGDANRGSPLPRE